MRTRSFLFRSSRAATNAFFALMAVAHTAFPQSATAAAHHPDPHDPTDTTDPSPVAAEDFQRQDGPTTAVSRGAFLPFSVAASSKSTYGKLISGYDGAKQAFVYDAAADAHVIGGLSVRAGYSSTDLSGHASALLGGRYQFLTQEKLGLDAALGFFYLPQDIDGEGLLKASLLLGRNFGALTTIANISYGQDPEGDDHVADLAVGVLYPLAPAVFIGADARARALVFSSDEKHNGISEPVFDAAAGPLLHYLVGPVTLTGEAGMSALVIEGPHGSTTPARNIRYGILGLLSAGVSL